MIESYARYRRLVAALSIVGFASACGDAVAPVAVVSVEVTSPAGALLDVGGTVRLSAVAKDQAGERVGGVAFTWTSSDPNVVAVDDAGSIEALAVGTATIRANGGGAGGSLALRVVDVDLAEITALATDPFVAALVGAQSADLRTRLQAAVANCTSGAGQGWLEAIQDCIAAVETEVANTNEPTDRVLLAVLGLFIDGIKRTLNS